MFKLKPTETLSTNSETIDFNLKKVEILPIVTEPIVFDISHEVECNPNSEPFEFQLNTENTRCNPNVNPFDFNIIPNPPEPDCGGDISILRTDDSLIAIATCPGNYVVNDSQVDIYNSDNTLIDTVTVMADSSIVTPLPDTTYNFNVGNNPTVIFNLPTLQPFTINFVWQ